MGYLFLRTDTRLDGGMRNFLGEVAVDLYMKNLLMLAVMILRGGFLRRESRAWFGVMATRFFTRKSIKIELEKQILFLL